MPPQQIPLIMEMIDNIVSPDNRKRKYTDRQIVKILIVLQLFNISYRPSCYKQRNYLSLLSGINCCNRFLYDSYMQAFNSNEKKGME